MRRLRLLAALVLAAAATIGFSTRALTAAGAQQSDKQQELQQQVSEASAAADAARAKVVDAQAQRQRFDSALADVTVRLAAANDRLVAAQATVDRLGFEALALQVKVEATEKKLAAARDDIRHSAVLLYRHGSGSAMIGLLGSTDGSGELVEGKHYLQRVNDKRQDDAQPRHAAQGRSSTPSATRSRSRSRKPTPRVRRPPTRRHSSTSSPRSRHGPVTPPRARRTVENAALGTAHRAARRSGSRARGGVAAHRRARAGGR